MSESFEIGEVAIFTRPGSTLDGIELTVTSGLVTARIKDGLDGSMRICRVYRVSGMAYEAPNRIGWCAPPELLRKKRPPAQRQEIGEWDLCPWQPGRTVARPKATAT